MIIYIGNLPHSATEEQLKQMFEQFGEVSSVKIPKDKFTGAMRGFGFVEMPNASEAEQAMSELNGREIDRQKVRVNEARPPEKRPARPRFGDSRGPRSNNSTWRMQGR